MKVGTYLHKTQSDVISSMMPNAKRSTKKNVSCKTVLLTHKNCPDGSTSALLMKKISPGIKVIFCTHQNINYMFKKILQQIEKSGEIWLSDICPQEDVIKQSLSALKQKDIMLNIYDHHKSQEWLLKLGIEDGKYLSISYDVTKSASKILYDHHAKDFDKLTEYNELVTIINDRDLWLNQHPLASKLAQLHRIYGDDSFVNRFGKDASCEFTEREEILLTYQKQKDKRSLEALLKRMAFKEDPDGFKYGVIYGEGSSSDVLNEALRRFNLEYALLINLNTLKVSVRGRGKFDCAKYASQYGGGGHVCASGFMLSDFEQPIF